MQGIKEVSVLDKAYTIMQRIHDKREDLRSSELFGKVSRLRHTAAALPLYVEQGCCKKEGKERAISFEVCFGAVCEVEYLLLVLRGRDYLTQDEYRYLSCACSDMKEMLAQLVGELRSTSVSEAKADC